MSAFRGFVTDAGKLTLDHRPAFDAYVKRLAGHECEIEIRKRKAKHSDKQRRGFHAMVTKWAHDEGHRVDDLKYDLMGEIFGWSEQPSPLTGRVVPLRPHTSELSQDDYNILIERTIEIAAGTGYICEAPSEYRERKEAAAKAAAKAARTRAA